MDKYFKSSLSYSCVLILHILICQSATQGPSLRKSLNSNYTVDPSASPYFPYCKFKGNPTPEISWSFNGQRLPTDDSRGGPYYFQGSGVLVLTGGISGMYTCTGTNQLGSESADVDIIIVTVQTTVWYLRPYMWFVFAIALWVVCIILMITLFIFCKKGKSAKMIDPVAEVWYNALSGEVRVGGRPDRPSTWEPIPTGCKVMCFSLQLGGPEYQQVLDAFNKTMVQGRNYTTIIKIERVQNPGLYSLYHQKKEEMETMNPPDHPNERQLFHGTDSDSAVKINTNGFNRSYAGRNAKVYGVGTYFARDASYSANANYSKPDANGLKHIYLARVLVGEYTVGNSNMTVPPPKNPQSNSTVLFDSLVDNIQNPSIFVVGPDAQSYPEYLIIFK